MAPFREEFDLLNALCARRLQLEIEPAPGVKVTMLNDYGTASDHAWWLPGPRVWRRSLAIVRFKVPKNLVGSSAGDPVTLGTIALRYTGIDGEPRCDPARRPARCPCCPPRRSARSARTNCVLRRLSELEAAGHPAAGAPRGDERRLGHRDAPAAQGREARRRQPVDRGRSRRTAQTGESNATKRCSRRLQRMDRGACSRGSRCGTKASMRVPRRPPPLTCGASRTRARAKTTTRRDHRRRR